MRLRTRFITGIAILAQFARGDSVAVFPALTLGRILQEMEMHDQVMEDSLKAYTCLRRYSLENHRFHKSAEISVRMTYAPPGRKKFEVLSEKGPSAVRQKVLRPMLEAEEEASRDDVRPQTRIVAANYDFKLIGTPIQDGRRVYLLEVSPKTHNKFLIRGRVWVDAGNFGIIRVEGSPAQRPSIFIHNTKVVQQSRQFGNVWLPLFNHSNTDSFLFGRTEVTIDSWDYQFSESGGIASGGESAR
jgi:hypothetical protein